MDLSLVPIEQLREPFRTKVEGLRALGADTRFFQFAANAQPLVDFYWGDFYQRVFFTGGLPLRLKELVRLRLAAHSGCTFCRVGDAASARSHGVSQEEIDALLRLELDRFDEGEQAALLLADHTAATTPPEPLADELGARLCASYSDEELVELFMVVGVLHGMGRMLVATGFTPVACEVPGPGTA